MKKDILGRLATIVLAIIIAMVVAAIMGGCATTPCRPPEVVMADKGLVLECLPYTYRDTGEVVPACLVRRPWGQVQNIRVTKPHCPVTGETR